METWVWLFQINDVVKFEGTEIELRAPTYKDALDKVKKLNLPSLKAYTRIEEALKLISVIEQSDEVEEDETDTETVED
jgi:hypothetical protein